MKSSCHFFLLLFFLFAATAANAPAQTTPEPGQPVEIRVTARRFEFDPKTITVEQGQRVKLIITSADVTHGFELKEYGIEEAVKGGATTTVEFTATRAGRFHFRCSIECGDGHDGMMGTLVVNETVTGQTLPVQFDDKTPGVAIIESGGARWRVDTNAKTVTRLDQPPSTAEAPPQPATGTPPAETKTAKIREPYDYHLINVPTPKAVVKGSLNLFFTHRFSQSVRPLRDSVDTLLGLDSFAVSSLGLSYGITDRLYVSAYRTPLCQRGICRTIEIGLGYHILDEAGRSPVALSAYASIEGQDNFTEEYTYNIQAMIARSVTKYVNVFFSPAWHINTNGQHQFNPRPENFFPPVPLANSFHLPKSTGSFGMGLNIRVRPSVSVLFE